ncbi:hypothetical protein QOT17_006099 [Balamuthia mandrillaris]
MSLCAGSVLLCRQKSIGANFSASIQSRTNNGNNDFLSTCIQTKEKTRKMAGKQISKKDLDNLKEQLDHMPRDKDRLRLVTAAAESHRFTCEQVKELVEMQHFGEAKTMTAVLTYPNLVDPENFEEVVLQAYQFAEDKEQVRSALGL